jgi:hypothetical protein
MDRMGQAARVGCPFCFEWIPAPKRTFDVYSPEGAKGGRCQCGAVFVVDETGKSGGLALLDAQTLLCDGDTERAIQLETDVHVEVKTRDFVSPGAAHRGHSYLTPKVWFVRAINPDER